MRWLFKSRLFWMGLAVKLLCLPFFGSYYIRDLFIPFVDGAVSHFPMNPWSHFPAHYFPYGTALLLFVATPKAILYPLFGTAVLGQSWVSLALMKAPLFLLDLTLLFYLGRAADVQKNRIIWLYWLNPILFYITYIHGQLDIASTTFCLASLYYLVHNRIQKSAVFFAIAALCKFHVVAIVPFILTFIWKREFLRVALKKSGIWCFIVGVFCWVGFLPHLHAGQLLYSSVSSPEAFRLFSASLSFHNNQLLLGVFVVFAIFIRLLMSVTVSERGLYIGSGLIFLGLLLGTDSMPGWHAWVVPFIALFFAIYSNFPKYLFVTYMISYLGVFLLSLPPGSLESNLLFTLMQCLLMTIGIGFVSLSLQREAPIRRRMSPLIIGISGDSGSGKNVLSDLIADFFTQKNSCIIHGDDYHKWERGSENWKQVTHLNPSANDLLKMVENIDSLAKGISVTKAHYDHETGHFTPPRDISPRKTMIVQGLHTLYPRHLRTRMNLSVYLDPEPRVRLYWKLLRDHQDRKHTTDSILSNIHARKVDSDLYILPQAQNADWIIQAYPLDSDMTDEAIIRGAEPRIAFRYILWNDAPIMNLLEQLKLSSKCELKLSLNQAGVFMPFDRLTVDVTRCDLSAIEIDLIAQAFLGPIKRYNLSNNPPKWHEGHKGVMQMIAALLTQQEAVQ